MRTLAILLSLFISQYLSAQNTVTVSVPNIPEEKGEVLFALFTEDTFMKSEPDFKASSKIENNLATAVFNEVPDGTYAIICFQDLNGNKQMDFDASGMPAENYGVSNNPMLYGPPQWDQSKFEVAGKPLDLEIRF